MEDMKIFDGFKHIGVYVVDRKLLTVYYENAIAQKYTGRCRIGEPCYQVHGNDMMCSTCPIRKKDHLTLVNRSDYNMTFAVRSEEIIWDGQEAYMISVVKQGDYSSLTEEEKSMSRMSRALKKSVNVYTEINMETMRYSQLNFSGSQGFNVDSEGDYSHAFEYMCTEEIHPDDVMEIRQTMSAEALRKTAYESEGVQEVSVRYRMKNAVPERIMESRAIFMRDEVPHIVVNMTKDVTKEVRLHQRVDAMENTLSHVSCGVAIYNMDKNGKVTVKYANEGLARLAECSKTVLMQQFARDFMFGISSEYRADFLDACKRITAGEKEAESSLYATTYKGNHLWLHVNLTATRKENGDFQIYGTYYDVTSDMKVQKEFQEKYEVAKRRTQDETSILAYAVFDLQNNRTIEMERRSPFNKIEEQFSLEDFCIDISNTIVSKEQKEKFVDMFNVKNLLEKHVKGIDEQSMEYQRRLPDGKAIWVKSSFHVIADLSKNTIFLFYYCNDINISKNIELMTAYMVDEDYDMIGYINLIDDSAVMLYGKNSSMRSAGYTEPQRQEKYSESLDWFVQHAIVPEERHLYRPNAFMEQIKENLAKKNNYEFTLHVRDEKLGIRTKKIRYTRNEVDGDSCFFSQLDITDTLAEEEEKQKRLQEALNSAKQANEAKTAFLSRMSHDMRTPMNTIIGLTSLSLDEEEITPELKNNLDNIRGASEFLLGLVNDILDMSKIDAGVVKLKYEPYDYKEFLAKLKAMFEPQFREKNITFDVEDMVVSTVVMADKLHMDQVFFNILSNAIKFTPEGGRVSYRTENLVLDEERISADYIISDTGIGMSPEFIEHIFEPFKQEDVAYTSNIQGTGLGMSISKRLVELMGGTIKVESKQNVGTIVTVHLAFNLCKHKDETYVQKENNSGLDILRGKRILLAEDHPLNARIAQKILEKKGLVVVHASNGKAAVNDFESSEPGYFDAILMDIRMPMMDGLEATKAIRGSIHSDAKTIPIIAMSANAYDEDVEKSLEVGMNAHIAKPIDNAIMFQTIANFLLSR